MPLPDEPACQRRRVGRPLHPVLEHSVGCAAELGRHSLAGRGPYYLRMPIHHCPLTGQILHACCELQHIPQVFKSHDVPSWVQHIHYLSIVIISAHYHRQQGLVIGLHHVVGSCFCCHFLSPLLDFQSGSGFAGLRAAVEPARTRDPVKPWVQPESALPLEVPYTDQGGGVHRAH